MRVPRLLLLLATLSLITALCACGGKTAGNPAGAAPPVANTGSGLPGLTTLAPAARLASSSGPEFTPLDPGDTLDERRATHSPGAIALEASEGIAYAIYGLGGFTDPGQGPTSARLTVGAISGEYWVAFADYAAGRWAIAGPFTNDAEVEIPVAENIAPYASPDDYVSASGSAYVALIVHGADNATFSGIELGHTARPSVGDPAPAPVTFARYTGMSSPLVLTWTPSASYADDDFAGYLVQRAPRYFGSFTQLTPEPISDEYFLDATGDPAQLYRIRIAAVDDAGNRSLWFTQTGPNEEPVDPICTLALPTGPLQAPAEVTFDMSGSFDPAGEAIDSYVINLGAGIDPLVSTTPVFTATLQPGCYVVGASITTADSGRYGSTARVLKVYPQWESAPSVVFDTDVPAADEQYTQLGMYRDPQSGRMVLSALDRTIPARVFLRDLGGAQYERFVYPTMPGSALQDPYALAGEYVIPIAFPPYTHAIATLENHPRYLSVAGTQASPSGILCSLGTADGDIWTIRLVGSKVYAAPESGAFPQAEILDNVASIYAADALFTPVSAGEDALVMIAFYDSSLFDYSLTFLKLSRSNGDVLDEYGHTGIFTAEIDLEHIDSAPALVYRDAAGYAQFLYYDDAADNWEMGPVDDSNTNGPFDLVRTENNFAYVYLSVGTPGLYEYLGGSTFALRNDISFTADSADDLSIMPVAGGQDLETLTLVSTGELYHAILHEDGTDTVLKEFLPEDVTGHHLCAGNYKTSAGEWELHLMARSGMDQHTEHVFSTDGETWTSAPALGESQFLDMTSRRTTGALYVSSHAYNLPLASLERWTGSGFNLEAEETSPGGMPALSQAPDTVVRWGILDSGSDDYQVFYRGATNGLDIFDDHLIKYGVIGPQVGFPRVWGAYEQSAPGFNLDSVSLLSINDADRDHVYDPPGQIPLSALENSFSAAHAMAASYHLGGLAGELRQVFWSVVGHDGLPTRVEVAASGVRSMAQLPGFSLDALEDEQRRSVSAVLAHGTTAAALLSDYMGETTHLEWSDYGGWEQLPLPPGLTDGGADPLSKAELAVDHAGRWHIFYHDYTTQQVKVWSTL